MILAKKYNNIEIPLDIHSKKVSSLALLIYEYYTKNNKVNSDIFEIIKISSLLHDIGKSTKQFQSKIKKNEDVYEDDKNIPYLHNQVGAAYAFFHLNISSNKIKHSICNIIYWHHGVLNNDNIKFYDIYKKLNDYDKEAIKETFINLLGKEYHNDNVDIDYNYPILPYYGTFEFNDDEEDVLLYARSIVIAADRLVSEYHSMNVNDILDKYKNEQKLSNIDINFTLPNNYDKVRFDKQLSIINDTVTNTSLLKAPAGFGKTILGLMWAIKNNKKVLWVCPRNSIAESVYISLLQELEAYDISDKLSIQLYLTGEVKNWNNDDKKGEFESDIIITNIDNYLKPSFDNSKLEQNFIINSANVVFDEFHELIQETALLSLFIMTMKIRHRFVNTKTLLLSATPNNITYLWDTKNNQTGIYPNKDTHFDAAHNKPYTIVDKKIEETNTLTICNSISYSQDEYLKTKVKCNDTILIHSLYTPKRRSELTDTLYKRYGKKNILKDKGKVISSPILQAGFDISFKNLNESLFSPDFTLQRWGRCNRWGEYIMGKIFFYRIDKLSEKKAILYNPTLLDKWYGVLEKLIGKTITLNDFYIIYNKFYKDNDNLIKNYNNILYETSKKHLKKIYPIKILNPKPGNKTLFAVNSNKLRTNNKEGIFYIVKCEDTKQWVGPFNDSNLFPDKYNIDKFKVFKVIDKLTGDDRFSYKTLNNTHKKNIGTETIKSWAYRSDKPLIVFEYKYNSELGVFKNV